MTTPIDPFARFEHDSWQAVAPNYEGTWSSLTRLFIPRLIAAARIAPEARVLDAACGPGYVAEAARMLGAKPLGMDFSGEMIRLARARCPDIEFREGNAEALDLEDAGFDALVMNFALFHLARPESALAEARRVLRPGGRFAFTLWAGTDSNPGLRIVEDAVRAHGDLSRPIPKGPDCLAYGNPESCREALARHGFAAETFEFLTVTEEWHVPTASFIFEAELHSGVRTAALLKAQSPEALQAIRAHLEGSVQGFASGGGFRVPYVVQVISISA